MRHIGNIYEILSIPPLRHLQKVLLAGFLFAAALPAVAQDTQGTQNDTSSSSTTTTTGPVIQGDVYGGGKNGAVFKSNTSNTNTDSAEGVTVADKSGEATTVTIVKGEVRTVFGGGQNGRTYGVTNVQVQGGTLGAEKWNNTIHGGIFGAGDGSSAYVFGASLVQVKGGTIYNNVYGGGNQADLYGSGTVTVQGGTYYGKVFGGARLANINGWSYVKLDGLNASASDKIIIPEVYGGNDISGKITPNTTWADDLPFTPAESSIDKTWNTFVEATAKTDANATGNIYVRNLYGGGNGDYDYKNKTIEGVQSEYVTLIDTLEEGEQPAVTVDLTSNGKPDADKVYLQLDGGTYGCVYGGGNSATVNTSTDIRLNNASAITTIPVDRAAGLNMAALGYTENNGQAVPAFQFERVFGGNNKVAMAIRPNWYLTQAQINNLYSGGNEGDMTHPQGIYLAVKEANVSVENVYGGCRKADVNPSGNKGTGTIPEEKFENDTYTFPAGYAARVLISGGKVRNVYGGNDVAGNVYYGNAVEIRSNIIGDVYGGGNGSYPYTDNQENLNNLLYADYYYDPTVATSSVEALNLHRPNAEKVMVHVSGTALQPVYVGGSVYCGGNSATLRGLASGTSVPTALFKVGSYAYMNNVFLGSNGANMISDAMLQKYAETAPLDYSTLDLTDHTTFEKYMEGAEVNIRPDVAFDAVANGDPADYVPYSTYVGSFYCGGNVGSMSAPGTFDINFLNSLVIFDKLVGGCNSANVPKGTYNAYHEGGMITKEATKINLNIAGLKLEPHNLIYDEATNTFSFPWKTEKGWRINKETGAVEGQIDILKGGNIYGGCYQSGYINGDVAINITSDAISENIMSSTGYLATNASYKLEDNTDYVFSTALTAFGAGYGENTDIWGNTRITVKDGGRILKVFGGGEEGVVGRVKGTTTEEQWFSNPITGSTQVNVQPGTTAYVGKAYGGGFEGLVTGNTIVNLDGGTVGNAYAGACNANINGYARMNVGTNNMSGVTVENDVYGGNDFGGSILGSQTNSGYADGTTVGSYTFTKLVKGVVKGNVFGGGSGFYNYEVAPFLTKTQETGFAYPSLPDATPTGGTINTDSYVDISADAEGTQPMATAIVGGGKGFLNLTGIVNMASTYVLLRGATTREASIATNIFGGGYYSLVSKPRVDAYSGKVGTIYGGTFGATADAQSGAALYFDPVKHINYNCESTMVNVYSGIDNLTMDVYGAGSYVGSKETNVNLYGGNINNVYGGSHFEGVVEETHVNVPEKSTANVNGLYGGSKGVSLELPCDVLTSHVNFKSATAYVRDVVYGGNHDYRATKITNIDIEVPLKSAALNGKYVPVVGGGLGANTVAGFTHVNLKDSSVVSNAYGGAREGLVLNQYNILGAGVQAYYADGTGNTYAHWQTDADNVRHTQVEIASKALVSGNVYGAGYGSNALVSGNTLVNLNGGTVQGDIYGGGYSGSMYRMTNAVTGYNNQDQHNITATVNVIGGTVRQVYGGGYAGTLGSTLATDTASTWVNIGIVNGTTFTNGIPAIQRSIYGGGERGAVYGSTHVHLNNGYVGYSYTGDADAAYSDKNYEQQLKLNSEDTKNLLSQNGNVFGGGYGEGAVTENTHVKLLSGTVRNSIYGGGEISAVGWGTVSSDKTTATITRPGKTYVEMYGGLVNGNVFGGGRGFSYDLSGNMQSGTEFYTDGYVFGSTDVNIYRGTVGAEELTAADNSENGNVFGGGNIGYVYGNSTKKASDGYYYDSTGKLSEDCRVSIKVGGIAEDDITIDGKDFKKGDFIPNESLNTMQNTDSNWKKINQDGVVIRNAVFAGGNVSKGSDKIYAFSNTVYGNVTAAVVDVFCRDLVAVGGNGIGGLYGDGNLTYVDGYRELNITNFGTDYYSLPGTLDLSTSDDYDKYRNLSDRQKEFYTEKYTYDGLGNQGEYVKGDIVKRETYNTFTDSLKKHWTLSQSVINEGRYINTIQRCDFCGIKGSRLVLNGAMDRAQNTSEADFTNYSINRVDELSLNRVTENGTTHGCYFGIYNVVKFLGSVTSDVSFDAVRTTESDAAADKNYDDSTTYGKISYREWKEANLNANNRNNGSSMNKIALASGVYLELVKSLDDSGDKVYGPITGVIELDLLNVTPGEGGGYVYAQNQHGKSTYDAAKQYASIISDANDGCVTNKAYTYATPTRADAMQTSGNFVNSLKRIIDDCFPNNDHYYGTDIAPAHYWYLRGEFFVYDQTVSAYTGAASSYSKDISIPLTMTAQSNGKIRLLNVLPGLYTDPEQVKYNPTTSASDSISINYEKTVKRFGQNDPISYWDWYMTNKEDRKKFILNTYACREDVTVDGKTYYAGQGVNEATYASFAGKTVTITNSDGTTETKDVQSFFNVTNAVNMDNGFILTLDLTNPDKWNTYYTTINSASGNKIPSTQWSTMTDAEKAKYVMAPSFQCTTSGVYGQYYFEKDELISKAVYDMQASVSGNVSTSQSQAQMEATYIAKDSCNVTIDGNQTIKMKGSTIPASTYNAMSATDKAHFEEAYICVSTVEISSNDYKVLNELVGKTEYDSYATGVQGKFQPVYYCTKEGSWGGKYYEQGKSYNGIDFCQLLANERQYFDFNYDALNLLQTEYNPYFDWNTLNNYATNNGTTRNHLITQYDKDADTEQLYSATIPVDYTATYAGTTGFTFKNTDGTTLAVTNGTTLTNVQYEQLPNERTHYAYFGMTDASNKTETGTYVTYIVKKTFDVSGVMYNAGKTMTVETYNSLSNESKDYVEKVELTKSGDYFYCIEEYTVGENDDHVDGFTSAAFDDLDKNNYTKGSTVKVGTILEENEMSKIKNYQNNFDVTGSIPVEKASLYVPVTASIDDLSKDRYVTVIYEYSYTECDKSGLHYETRVEKHIVNLRIQFMSGNPIIGKLKEPELVLPLEKVGLDVPAVEEGAFPVLSGGWEIYATEQEAKKHRNGREYINNGEQMYWCQDQYYIAYYAETRMGKTFSDPVPVHVANYHRLSDVLKDSKHMFIDHVNCKRDPKIYIDDRTFTYTKADNSTFTGNELDGLQDLYALTNSDFGGKNKNQGRDLKGCANLDFFIQSNVSPTIPWTSLGDDTQCFEGELHGNGHRLEGMQQSLFGNLCGRVHNLGVLGTFSGGGVAETGDGYVENCWIYTEGNVPSGTTTKAVYGNPDAGAKIINCYYPNETVGTNSSNANYASGEAIGKPVQDFLDGHVAFYLNRYYLEARYKLSSTESGGTIANQTFYRQPEGAIEQQESTEEPGTYENKPYEMKYDADYAWYSKWNDAGSKLGYIEKYYEDGDFRYADGLKPLKSDLRQTSQGTFIPVYPDDYIIFGQILSYGLYPHRTHGFYPDAIVKHHTETDSKGDVDNSLSGLVNKDGEDNNLIFRAPAYFGNGVYGKSVLFNASAAFKDEFSTGERTWEIQPKLTAIDFTGYGAPKDSKGNVQFSGKDNNYQPLLTYEGLNDIKTSGITQNLLVYMPSSNGRTVAETSAKIVTDYFKDIDYSESDEGYRAVDVADASTVKGHVVLQAADGSYVANNDHYLVDKQDFNCPIAYKMASSKVMGYQRTPDNYVDASTGWEAVCLPFAAELVTTQDKGEITHFYTGSTVGHEYWLREYTGIDSKSASSSTSTTTAYANFASPAAGSNEKEVTNTYLWDYYYEKDNQLDKNSEEYQTYYKDKRTYNDYPYSQPGMPYILGLPGSRYYEFDLSGNFEPLNRYQDKTIDHPGKQTVTFVSEQGAEIKVSDDELTKAAVKKDGYIFTPCYTATELSGTNYLLNANGGSFDEVATGTTVTTVPFRPFFVLDSSSSGGSRTRSLLLSSASLNANNQTAEKGLVIYSRNGKIVVESHLKDPTMVTVRSVSGATIARFNLASGEKKETPIYNPGVYLINNYKLYAK